MQQSLMEVSSMKVLETMHQEWMAVLNYFPQEARLLAIFITHSKLILIQVLLLLRIYLTFLNIDNFIGGGSTSNKNGHHMLHH